MQIFCLLLIGRGNPIHSTSLSKEIKSSVDLEKALNKAAKRKHLGKSWWWCALLQQFVQSGETGGITQKGELKEKNQSKTHPSLSRKPPNPAGFLEKK